MTLKYFLSCINPLFDGRGTCSNDCKEDLKPDVSISTYESDDKFNDLSKCPTKPLSLSSGMDYQVSSTRVSVLSLPGSFGQQSSSQYTVNASESLDEDDSIGDHPAYLIKAPPVIETAWEVPDVPHAISMLMNNEPVATSPHLPQPQQGGLMTSLDPFDNNSGNLELTRPAAHPQRKESGPISMITSALASKSVGQQSQQQLQQLIDDKDSNRQALCVASTPLPQQGAGNAGSDTMLARSSNTVLGGPAARWQLQNEQALGSPFVAGGSDLLFKMPPIPDDDSCGMDYQQESHNRPSPSTPSGLYSPSALSIRSLVGKSLAAVVTNRQQYQQSSAVRRASTNIVPRSASRVMSLSRAGSSTLSSMNWIGARSQQASAAAGNPFSVSSTVRALPLDIPLPRQSVSSQVAASSGRRVGSSKKIFRQGSGNLSSSMVDATTTTVASSYNPPAGSLVLPPSILKSFQIIRDLRVHVDASGTSYLAMPTPLSRRTTSRSQRPLLPSSLSTQEQQQQEQQQQEQLSCSANNAASLPPSPTAPSKEVRLMAASALSARAAEYAARGSARSSRLDQN